MITPPASQTAEAGSQVVFAPSTVGNQKVVYQWLFNGTGIQAEATTNSALYLAGVQPGQPSRLYRLVAVP